MTRIFSKRSLENDVIIDHTNSPGITREQAAATANICAPMPAGRVFKSPTFTCSKCQVQVILNPDRSRSRGYCRKCDHDVCDRCSLLLKLNHECTFDSCWHIKRIALEYGKVI